LPFATGPSSFFTPPVTSATFTTTLNVTSGFVSQVTSGISQRDPGTRVPGPLPLLGAGAAFGFSRRIRNRIKVAA
jgi:MYXO-CTERM domain-containing protein